MVRYGSFLATAQTAGDSSIAGVAAAGSPRGRLSQAEATTESARALRCPATNPTNSADNSTGVYSDDSVSCVKESVVGEDKQRDSIDIWHVVGFLCGGDGVSRMTYCNCATGRDLPLDTIEPVIGYPGGTSQPVIGYPGGISQPPNLGLKIDKLVVVYGRG